MQRPFGVLVLLLVLVAREVNARQAAHGEFVSPSNQIEWTVAASGAFGRTTVGRVGVGPGSTAVVMRGSTAVCLIAPATHATLWPLAGAVNDADFVPGGAGSGVDVLAVVDAFGLHLRSYDATAMPDRFTIVDVPFAAFAGASRVRSGDLDGDARFDLLVVGADRVTVTPVMQSAPGAWVVAPSFAAAAGHEILDLEDVGWTGSANRQVAVCSTYGLEIFDLAGERLWHRRCVHADNFMAVVAQPGGPTPSIERVALVYRTLSGTKQRLGVHSAYEEDEDLALQLPAESSIDVVGLAAGDRDGDGDDDLLVAHQAAHDLRLLLNQRGAQSGGSFTATPSFVYAPFTSGVTVAVPLGDPAVSMDGNTAVPVLADLDDDGLADAFTPVFDAEFAVLHPAVEIPLPEQVGAGSAHPVFKATTFWIELEGTPNVGAIQIDVDVRDAWDAFAPPVDDLELMLWYQPEGATYVQSVAVGHVVFVDPSPIAVNGDTWRISFTLPMPAFPAAEGFTDRYFLTIGFVEWDGTNVVQARRAYAGGLTAEFSPSTVSMTYLTSLPGAWPVTIPFSTPGSDGGVLLGGYVPQARIPPLDPLFAPTVPPAVEVAGNGPLVPGS